MVLGSTSSKWNGKPALFDLKVKQVRAALQIVVDAASPTRLGGQLAMQRSEKATSEGQQAQSGVKEDS